MIDIVICWQAGTEEMVKACLTGIIGHTYGIDYRVHLVSLAEETKGSIPYKLDYVSQRLARRVFHQVEAEQNKPPTKIHGYLLDKIIPEKMSGEYVLTLDSDCIPMADGWLQDLVGMIEGGASLAGILHPWAPPPADLSCKKIEWRVRSQHCWENTHVACQLIRLDLLKELWKAKCSFSGGDDTGLLIPNMVKKQGGKIAGFKPTRCPVVWEGDFDPEFNRYSCLVFGDKVYHHGGFSRGRLHGDEQVFAKSFGWCEKLVLWGYGAEFLLDDRFSYRFKFDREEEIAKEKMQRLFGLKSQKMLG